MLARIDIPANGVKQRAPAGLALVVLLLTLAVPASLVRSGVSGHGTGSPILPSLAALPLQFVPNAGQTDPAVSYIVRSGSGTFYFTKSGATLSVASSIPTPERSESSTGLAPGSASSALYLQFVGSNTGVTMQSGAALPGKVNYFLGDDPAQWRAGLPIYDSITYEGIYPGVDLAYTGDNRTLKGTYTVAPGADPGAIRWRYAGASSVRLDASGNLQAVTEGECTAPLTVTERAPTAWQEIDGKRVAVSTGFVQRTEGIFGFSLGSYDLGYPLIIDPYLAFSTYLGGSFAEWGDDIAVDKDGNAYIAGYTPSTNYPTTPGAYQRFMRGTSDVFVSKISPGGSLIYSTFLGGAYTDYGTGVATDNEGNAYITGWTGSTDFPTLNAFQPAYAGGWDAFVTKLNPDGSALIYSTYLGGSGQENAVRNGVPGAIAADSRGYAYITGDTDSSDFPTTAGAYQPTLNGGSDAFLVKMSPDGDPLVYSTYLGGENADAGYGVTLDTQGNVYLAGRTWSFAFPLVNPFQGSYAGLMDAFVSKFNPSATTLLYSTYLGGGYDESAGAIAVDSSGSAYVSGYTGSSDFPVSNAFQPFFGGLEDGFVTKFSPSGSQVAYSTFLGGSWIDILYGIDVDSGGASYVAGYSQSDDFPTVNAIQPTRAGGDDIVLAKLRPDGSSPVWSTYLGGNTGYEGGRDYGRDIAVDAVGNAWVTGDTSSTNWPVVNPIQANNGGFYDAFVIKVSNNSPNTPTTTAVASATASPTSTNTPVVRATETPTGTPNQGTSTPIATPTPCPMNFTDVRSTDYFYEAVRYLYCRGVISGYSDNTFRPYNNATRGQIAKIVVIGFGLPVYTPPIPTFSDVPANHPFYPYVEAAYSRGIISGYSDGTFRPGNNVTRGQLTKIVALAADWPLLDPLTPTFVDVPRDHPFYRHIETAHARGVISGYADGTFRPASTATRGQISKIINNALSGSTSVPVTEDSLR